MKLNVIISGGAAAASASATPRWKYDSLSAKISKAN